MEKPNHGQSTLNGYSGVVIASEKFRHAGESFLKEWMGLTNYDNWMYLMNTVKIGNLEEFIEWLLTTSTQSLLKEPEVVEQESQFKQTNNDSIDSERLTMYSAKTLKMRPSQTAVAEPQIHSSSNFGPTAQTYEKFATSSLQQQPGHIHPSSPHPTTSFRKSTDVVNKPGTTRTSLQPERADFCREFESDKVQSESFVDDVAVEKRGDGQVLRTENSYDNPPATQSFVKTELVEVSDEEEDDEAMQLSLAEVPSGGMNLDADLSATAFHTSSVNNQYEELLGKYCEVQDEEKDMSREQAMRCQQTLGGATAYICPECGKTFRVPSRLQRHYHIHSGHKPYTCRLCQRAFTQKANLKTHLLTFHQLSQAYQQ